MAEVVTKSRKSNPKRGSKPGERRGGRQKGTPNLLTVNLKQAILDAATAAHPKGMVGYLTQQAKKNPNAFMAMLGKTLPKEVQVSDPNGDPLLPPTIKVEFVSPKGG